ncbi:MAG TPA: DJ-1/PfpI family protein [Caulobacteraceae bacterium]|nr:DJ-1/PfpI family protein [Caulobacteraceae bacterium]
MSDTQPTAPVVVIPVYQGVDLLDVAGPMEMFYWAGFDVHVVGETAGDVVTKAGLTIRAAAGFADAPAADVLWTPGGDPASLLGLMAADCLTYLQFLVDRSQGATLVASVCEGALLLAAAGLLDGYRATTHWAFIPCLRTRFPKVKLAPGYPRFWLDGNRLTGGGISSGLDEALEVIRLLKGDDAARDVQQTTQYYPRPPVMSTIPDPDGCPLDGVTPTPCAALKPTV